MKRYTKPAAKHSGTPISIYLLIILSIFIGSMMLCINTTEIYKSNDGKTHYIKMLWFTYVKDCEILDEKDLVVIRQ